VKLGKLSSLPIPFDSLIHLERLSIESQRLTNRTPLRDSPTKIEVIGPFDPNRGRRTRQTLDTLQCLCTAPPGQIDFPQLAQHVGVVVVELYEFHRELSIAGVLGGQTFVDADGPRVKLSRVREATVAGGEETGKIVIGATQFLRR